MENQTEENKEEVVVEVKRDYRQEAIDLGRKMAKEMTSMVNSSSREVNEAFIEKMSYEHRTLQQSFTRLCLQWLEHLAKTDRIDGRNEASQKVAKTIREGFIKSIAEELSISPLKVEAQYEDCFKPSSHLPTI